MFLCVTSAIAVYNLFKDRSLRKLLFLGCAFFLVWSSGTYFGNFSNEAEHLMDWDTQMDHVNDTDNLYLVTDDGAYYSYRRLLAQDVTFNVSEGVTLSQVSKNGTEASFTYEKADGTGETYVEAPLNYYPYYHVTDENGNELATDITELLGCASLCLKLLPVPSPFILRFRPSGVWEISSLFLRLPAWLPLPYCPAGKERRLNAWT